MRAKESPGKAGEGRPWDGDGKSVAEALPAVFHQPLNAFFSFLSRTSAMDLDGGLSGGNHIWSCMSRADGRAALTSIEKQREDLIHAL